MGRCNDNGIFRIDVGGRVWCDGFRGDNHESASIDSQKDEGNTQMNFSDFFTNTDPIIQEMAKRLDQYAQQLKSNQISQDEYNDLVNDATLVDDVARAGKTLAELALLDQTIAMLKEIAAAVPI